jgi:hypothetical protein
MFFYPDTLTPDAIFDILDYFAIDILHLLLYVNGTETLKQGCFFNETL